MTKDNSIKDYDIARYSQKDLWSSQIKIGTVIVFLMLIYGRFLNVESNQGKINEKQLNISSGLVEAVQDLKDRMDEKDKSTNARLDKKTLRIEEDLDKAWLEIEKLKQPNTDKNE